MWVKYYIGFHGEEPKLMAHKFRRRFGIACSLYDRIRGDIFSELLETWETLMIGVSRPGKPTEVKILNCLNMLASGNCPVRNDKVAYMEAEPARQYSTLFCSHIVEVYAQSYLKRWGPAQNLDDVKSKYEAKGFLTCVGAINCTNL